MVIVGVTGPVSIFLDTTYAISKALDVPFLPFTSWIYVWYVLFYLQLLLFFLLQLYNLTFIHAHVYVRVRARTGIMHILLAAFNACDLVSMMSRFSCEIFGALIAVIYIVEAVRQIVTYFSDFALDAALLSLVLALGTLVLAMLLSSVRNTRLFNYRIRSLIADYAMSASGMFLFFHFSFCYAPAPAHPFRTFWCWRWARFCRCPACVTPACCRQRD